MENAGGKKLMKDRSLCFDRQNAYASRCQWVDGFVRVWSQASERVLDEKGRSTTLFKVSECDSFLRDEERGKYAEKL